MAKKSVKSTKRPNTKRSSYSSAKKAPAKKSPAQRPPKEVSQPRWLKQLRFHKPVSHPVKLPPAWQITRTAATTLWQNKLPLLAIAGLYGLMDLIFVKNLTSSINTASLQSTLDHITATHLGSFFSGLGTFIVQASSSAGSAAPTAGSYQLVFAIIASLATIWALRQLLGGNTIRIRNSFYRGMYPLIPFILVLVVICFQLLPFVIGAKLYTTVITDGIAVNVFEKACCLGLFILLALWSLYMITATVIALYIVTLPDMTPLKAIRSARELVRHRRFIVLSKILFLPLILVLITAVIMLLTIVVLASAVPWVLFLLTMTGLVAVNVYMYTLYRELLNE